MKRYLKMFAVFALILPIAVIMAACGGKPLEGSYKIDGISINNIALYKSDFKLAPEEFLGLDLTTAGEAKVAQIIESIENEETKLGVAFLSIAVGMLYWNDELATDDGEQSGGLGVPAEMKIIKVGKKYYVQEDDDDEEPTEVTIDGGKLHIGDDEGANVFWNKKKGIITINMPEEEFGVAINVTFKRI
ncbi:MAG: hypothetical protein LBG88_01670 [Christensenellaceae bacterium]|nr:hypothetical protein [Christensenellaceae bacterium]